MTEQQDNETYSSCSEDENTFIGPYKPNTYFDSSESGNGASDSVEYNSESQQMDNDPDEEQSNFTI